MSDAVLIAVIVAIPALLSAPLMAWLTNRNAASKEKRDHAREDVVAEKAAKVAEKAAEAAQLLLQRQEEVSAATAEQARLLKENNRVVSEQAASTTREIKKLSGMLDGNFTKLMEDNLAALTNGLISTRQVLALTFEAGHETDPATLAEIEATKGRIEELKKAIAERKRKEASTSAERGAAATERSALANERIADAAEAVSAAAAKKTGKETS